jgi:glycosyltransferase involved in cell wall biosynthesis
MPIIRETVLFDLAMTTVSVIIPTYNREKFVVKAIDSVLNQSFVNYEIIVIDDGSEDNTKENLKKYGDKIKYIYQDNYGVSAARNAGIKIAEGQWLAFLDSDDEWSIEYLSKQIERASLNPGICMQTTNCNFVGLNGQKRTYFEINGVLGKLKSENYLFIKEPFYFIVKHGPWQIGSTIIRRDAILKAQLFDTNFTYSEDLDLMARVALQGSFGLINEALVNIYRRDESIESLTSLINENSIQERKINEKVYEKLLKIETLKRHEHRVLKNIISSNRRAMGNLLLKKGDIKGAREFYKSAIFIDRSIVSFGRYILSCCMKKS